MKRSGPIDRNAPQMYDADDVLADISAALKRERRGEPLTKWDRICLRIHRKVMQSAAFEEDA